MDEDKTKVAPQRRWYSIEKALLPIKGFYFLYMGGMGNIYPFMPLYMKHTGLTSQKTGILHGIMPFVGALTRPIYGMIADKTQRYRLVVSICIISAFIFYLLLLVVPVEESDHVNVSANIHCDPYTSYIYSCPQPDTLSTCPIGLSRYMNYMNITSANRPNMLSECDISCKRMSLNRTIDTECREGPNDGPECNMDVVNIRIFNITESLPVINNGAIADNCTFFEFKFVENMDAILCRVESKFECLLECQATQNTACTFTKRVATSTTFWTFLVLYMLAYINFSPVISTGTAITYNSLKERKLLWGRQRVFGAFGFAICAVASTAVREYYMNTFNTVDFSFAFYTLAVFHALSVPCVALMPAVDNLDTASFFQQAFKLLRKRKVFSFLCLILLLGILNGSIESFLFWYLQDTLKSTSQILPGLAILVSCTCETPALILTGKLIKKIGHLPCICIACVAFGVRLISYSFLTNAWQVLGVETLHSFTFGMLWPAATAYAKDLVPPEMSATIQGLLSGTKWGLGKGLGSIITGQLYLPLGIRWTYRLYGILAFIAVPIFVKENWDIIRQERNKIQQKTLQDENRCEDKPSSDSLLSIDII